MRNILRLAIYCILTSGIYACINDDIEMAEAEKIKVGERLPQFSVTTNDGSTFHSDSIQGYASVIIFFNTECPDCRKELPVLQSVYDKLDKSETYLLCISREQDSASVNEYWMANNFNMPYSAQTTRNIYELFALQTIPRIYVSDKEQIVRAIFTDSPLATEEDITSAILAACGEKN